MAANRTIEPGITVLSESEIRVAVLPIGPIPKDVLLEYVQVFSKYRHVPLNSTRSFYQSGAKSPFQHLPWKTGRMHFRFQRADEVARRHRMTPLHAQRQVMAVLGLVHCPLTENLAVAMDEFNRSSRQLFPEALVYRCCAFEPGQQHMLALTQEYQELMIFPAGHLEQHLEVYMHEFAASMLAELEAWVLNSTIADVKLSTYMDTSEFTGSLVQLEEGLRKLNLSEEDVKEKKKWGRLLKAKGDMALLAGSPRDAFEHYKSACELSKSAGDFIWSGACMEGLAHARIMEALCTPRTPVFHSSVHSRLLAPAVRTSTTGATLLTAAAAAITPGATPQPPAAAAADGAPAAAGATESSAPAAGAGAVDVENIQLADAGGSKEAAGAKETSQGAAGNAQESEDAASGGVLATSTAAAAADEQSGSPGPSSPPVVSVAAPPAKSVPDSSRPGADACPLAQKGAAYSIWGVVREAEILDELRELLSEARAWYKKKGGAAVLQIEQQLKLARLVAALLGAQAAAHEVMDLMKQALEAAPGLHLVEDRLVTLVEAAQLLGMVGCGRKRLLLLWHAMDQSHGLERAEQLTLRIAAALLEPPEVPGYQVSEVQQEPWYAVASPNFSLLPDIITTTSSSSSSSRSPTRAPVAAGAAGAQRSPARHSGGGASARASSSSGCSSGSGRWGSISNNEEGMLGLSAGSCGWNAVHLAALEATLAAARQCGAATDAWEAAAALLRCHWRALSPPTHTSLCEALQQSASSMSRRARSRPGPGPGPWVALKRVLPGPPALQPVRMSLAGAAAARGAGSDSGQGPFIVNPYAAKRAAAAAAAAAEVPQMMEWVTGDSCQVEVVLVNPTSVPFKVDLQLNCSLMTSSSSDAVPTSSSQLQQEQQIPPPDSSSSSSTSSAVARPAAVQQMMVQVVVPTGGKALKQLMGVTPLRPGILQIHGITAAAWGASWNQDFCELPKSGLNPAPEYNWAAPVQVSVLPRLPQMQAHLKGTGVDLQFPAAEDLQSPATPGMSDVVRRAATVNVFEGQRITWNLTLTNISSVAVGACQVSVVNQKGQVVKPLGLGAQLPASFTGAHMEAREAGLLTQLPLQSGRTLAVPVALLVGRAPADMYEGVHLELHVTYAADADAGSSSADPAGSSSGSGSSSRGASSGGVGGGTVMARKLVVPVRFHIQPTLQITHISLLQSLVPLSGGKRAPGVAPLNLQDANLIKEGRSMKAADSNLNRSSDSSGRVGLGDAATAGAQGHGSSRHVRNSSAGAVLLPSGQQPLLSIGPAPSMGLDPAASDAAHGKQQLPGTTTSSSRPAGEPHASSTAVAAADAGPGGTSTGLPCTAPVHISSQPVLEIGVKNVSDRYFRTWVSWLPSAAHGPAGAESAVVVLEPGDTTCLLCTLPAHLANSPAAAEAATAALQAAALRNGPSRQLPPSTTSSSFKGSQSGTSAASSAASSATAGDATAAAAAAAAAGQGEPVTWQVAPTRVTCAELLSEVLGVMWEMITGEAATEKLPGGVVKLTALQLARSITPGAMTSLCVPQLQLGFQAGTLPPAAAAPAGPLQLVDVAPQLEGVCNIRQIGMLGPVWGVALQVGQLLPLQLQLVNRSSRALQLQYSITWQELIELAASSSSSSSSTSGPAAVAAGGPAVAAAVLSGAGDSGRWSMEGSSSFAARGGLTNSTSSGAGTSQAAAGVPNSPGHAAQYQQQQQQHPGLFVSGLYSRVHVSVAAGSTSSHPLTVMGVAPGVYQLGVSRVASVEPGGVEQPLYHGMVRLLLLVTAC